MPSSSSSGSVIAGGLPRDGWDSLLRLSILLALALVLYVCVVSEAFDPVAQLIRRHQWMQLIVLPSALWVMLGMVMLLLRTLLWYRYCPVGAVTPDEAPSITVIIPAYNEGAMVARSIDSVVSADYPRERIEIIVIDDGSRDDTWLHIQHAVARHGEAVTAVQFPENRGKRAALALGFQRARGEICVTVDSDSVIERDALRALVSPFSDARVGAVAGKVSVHNREAGLIPRMLDVRFVLSFDFLRAAQSVFRTVYCTPGALSAYRTSVVRGVLDAWVKQTFWRVPCDIGEDRALTNDILAQGYDSVYQCSAVVHTLVPTTYAQLCRMFLRWDRSDLREELRFARIVWRRPWRYRVMAVLDMLITNLRYPVIYASLGLTLFGMTEDPEILLRLLFSIGLMSLLYTLYYLRSRRSLDFVYGIAYAYYALFALTWVFPYALITISRRGWLTR